MFPPFLFQIPGYVAGLRITVANLPSGDVERTRFVEAEGGVRAFIERQTARSDTLTRRQVLIPQGDYLWSIEEERRTVLMATPGRPTGVVRRAFRLVASVDRRDRNSVNARPVEAYRFYAPTREAAEGMQSRLRRALRRD